MEIKQIPLSLVTPSPMNPRKTFDEGELQELADNIGKQGLLQPVTVRPIHDLSKFPDAEGNPEYEIICGERRYRAFRRLSAIWDDYKLTSGPDSKPYKCFSEIPAIVREMSDDEAFDAMITENLQRKDVDPIEEAFAFGQLIQKGDSLEEIAARFGRSIRFVQDRVKLNDLIPELMLEVREKRMSLSAAMIIAKLDEEHQRRYHSSYANNPNGFSKQTAESFTQSLFMSIDNAPWYQTNEDKDYDGGCGRKCSECQYNTANHGCLFWEMKTNDAGKCTNRAQFCSKQTAFILDSIKRSNLPLIKHGAPLESGGVVIIDDEEYCPPSTKVLKSAVFEAIKDAGYEVVKANELFEGKCWYTDERLDRNIKSGNVYKCLRISQYSSIQLETEWRYFNGKRKTEEENTSTTAATSAQSVDAMKLMQKRNRIREIAIEKLTEKSRTMAANLEEAKRKGELSDAEMFAFQIIIFTLCGQKMLEKYGHKGFGKPSDRSFIDIIKQNRADWPMWIREFIRNIISSADINYNSLYQYCASQVLREWMPKEFHETAMAISDKLGKDLSKNAEKLKALGYDTNGKLLPGHEPSTKTESPAPSSGNIPKRYNEMKAKHPDAILLFRVGDFYECYEQDAENVADVLNLTLTTSKGYKLAGFPHHALDTYLPRLIQAGQRVAICEQPEKN